MWLFNSCHLPVSPASFPASPLSPSDYTERVRRNRELNLSSAWMHRSHLKFCGLRKFTWQLCPIILPLAIWTVKASRMVRRYQRVAPSLSDSLQKLLYKPNRFSAFKDVRDVKPCCQLLSHCRVWDPDFQSLPLLELLSTLLFTLDIGLLACASLTPVRVSDIFKPFQLFVFVPFCWDLFLSVKLISHNWHHKFVFLPLTVYCREGSRLLPWY